MRDGSMRAVPHVLKDGADSIGIAGAALRVYLNIGMCGDYLMTLHDPIDGVRKAQQPFDMDHARAACEDWRNTEARMPAAEAFLKTLRPVHLADAPGGRRVPHSQRGRLAPRKDRLCRYVRGVPFEQAAAGGYRGPEAVDTESPCSPTIS